MKKAKGGMYGMKKKHLLMLVVLLFSFIVESVPSLTKVYAETTNTELINENYLQLSYDVKSQDDAIHWRISFKRQSEDSDTQQRLKLKVTNEKGEVINYPKFEQMTSEKEWLVENAYSSSMEGQFVFKLPKSVQMLNLEVQMDQQTALKDGKKETEEDILSIKKPFELRVKETKEKTKTSSKTEKSVSKKGEATIDSEEFIGPKVEEVLPATAVPYNGLLRMDPPKYTNKAPLYTTSPSEGIYPTCNWTPTGQSNVLNHQGGYERENGWDGVTSWNLAQDDYTKSYIKYGVEKTKPNIALRKLASETNKEDAFDVQLNVRGSTIAKPGVDVCFVLDNSNSMVLSSGYIGGKPRKTLAVDSLQKLIDKFKAAQPETDSLRLGGIIYSSASYANSNRTVPMTSNESGWQNLVNTYKNTPSNGDTYTQKALMDAQTMLNNTPGTNRRKVIFLLTDGAPNISVKPLDAVSDSNVYYDGLRIINYDKNSVDSGSMLGNSNIGSPAETKILRGFSMRDGHCLYSHLTPANSTALDIKEQGMEIFSIAINIKSTLYQDHTTSELIRGLYKMASKKSNATGDAEKDYQFFHANTQGDFDISFEDWFTSVIQTVDKGKIEDPIGDMYELIGTPKVKELKKSGVPAIESNKLPNHPVVANNKITVDNINLYGNQEIQLDYTLRLKTEHPNYEGGKWYQTNGKTTLEPTPERTTDKLEFGVPSARGKAEEIKIPVEKKWSDIHLNTENYWELRANSVKVVLQRKSGNSWVDVETKTLSAANNWADYFTAEGGNKTTYRVVELARTTGYAKPTSNVDEFTAKTLPSKGVQITNKLLKGKAVICKYKEDGKTPFTKELPRFTVRRKSDGKLLAADLEPDANGQVTISDIPLGDFIVEESYVPDGYAKMENIDLKAVENGAGTDLILTMNGKSSPYKVTNKLSKDLKIPVEKIWSDEFKGTDNYWGLRQMYVRVNLQRKNGNSWETIEQKILTPTTNWKDTFAGVEGGNHVYRVVEETRVTGYAKPTYNYSAEFTAANVPTGGVKLTNKLLKDKIVFYKYKQDGKTPFDSNDLPKFSVRRKSDNKLLAEELTPNANGAVTISDIPLGEFILEETYVPKGYKKTANVEIRAVENSSGTGLVIYFDGKTGSTNKIKNELADFALVIKKVDQDGNELRGASFRLVGTNNDQTQSGGPLFVFDGLRPGEYQLTETVIPNGYTGLTSSVRISISQEGVVTIQNNPNVSGSGGIGNDINQIDLTITNKKKRPGALPSTGGSGTATIFKIAIGVTTTAGGLLGSLFWLHTKRRGS
ncbi:MAG: SpaA isopeptide-forming pilin-related protein [Carnobacterium sp.]|uniref:SpaA isopeptide-forming pilin-related protein n=1 Tax=Carnobacterium sp. TaxID=48221 RepID=UPI002FC6FFDF